MSIEAINWAVEQQVGSKGDKFVLFMIANCASPAGIAYPGQVLLSERCECNVATINRCLKRLERRDGRGPLIGRAERRRPNGSRTSDWIVLGPRMGESRAPMRAPHEQEGYPESVWDLVGPPPCKTSPDILQHDEWSPDETDSTHVAKSGGPDPSVEPSDQLPPVSPASGGRKRDRERWEREWQSWARREFPDLDPKAVVGYAKSALSTGATSLEDVRSAVVKWTGGPS